MFTPASCTSLGNRGPARATRFCTSIWARHGSTPGVKLTSRAYLLLVQRERRYLIFSSPLTCCSMGERTESETAWALAPAYAVSTRIPEPARPRADGDSSGG